jgi:hypothetical protein
MWQKLLRSTGLNAEADEEDSKSMRSFRRR